MKKRKLLLCALLSLLLSTAHAGNTYDGIFVVTNNSEVCYKISDVPKITYKNIDGVKYAVLQLKDSTEPVLTIPINTKNALQIVYGTYIATSINEVQVTTKNNRKYISGGKLIIINNGKKYNTEGTLIK